MYSLCYCNKNSSFMLYTYAFTQTRGVSGLSHKTLTSEVPKVKTAYFTHCGLRRRGCAQSPHRDKIFSHSLIFLIREKEFNWSFSKALNEQGVLIITQTIIPLFPIFHVTIPIYLVKIMAWAHPYEAITQPPPLQGEPKLSMQHVMKHIISQFSWLTANSGTAGAEIWLFTASSSPYI